MTARAPLSHLLASFFACVVVFAGSPARAQAPELAGVPAEHLQSLDPAAFPVAAAESAPPSQAQNVPAKVPVVAQPVRTSPVPEAPPSNWLVAVMAIAGVAGAVVAGAVLTLAVREMRREAEQRRRKNRRRVRRSERREPEVAAS